MATYATTKISLHITNLEVCCEEFGVGTPLILLHGFGGCTQNWYQFVNVLAQHYRLILVEFRENDYSTNPDDLFMHRAAANDTFQLINHLEINPLSAMGMSSDDMTLLHMATRQPERIERNYA